MTSTQLYFLLGYLCAINLVAIVAAAVDKYRAVHGGWRIRERTLLVLGFLGGAPGAFLAMLLIRHKTRRLKFMLTLPIVALLQAAGLVWLCFFATPMGGPYV